MTNANVDTPISVGRAEAKSHRGAEWHARSSAVFKSSNLLIAFAASAYALLCADLLVHNTYLGVAAAVLPGAAVVPFQTRLASATLMRRQSIFVWLVLVAVAPPWQSVPVTADGSISTSSAVDAVKLLATTLAVGLAFIGRVPNLKYPFTVKALLGYATVAVLGALATDSPSSLLRAARFAAVVLATIWVTGHLSRHRLTLLFVQFSVVVSFISLVARAAGLGSAFGSRLAGYLPPLHPNVLGLLAAGGLLCLTASLARKELRFRAFAMTAPILTLTVILTQSRTSIVGLLGGLLALAVPHLRSRAPIILGVLGSALVIAALIQTNTQSHPLTSLLTHNGSTSTTATLGSRVSEWTAVQELNKKSLTQAVGQGLAAKTVEVDLRSAQYASVDGTWVAAYLSAGVLGVIILAISVLAALRMAIRSHDDLAVAVIVFLIINSLVADVFNDVTIGLVLFLSVCVSSTLQTQPQGEFVAIRRPSQITVEG